MTGIAGIAYAFPKVSRSIAQLAGDGALESDAGVLRRFGFDRVHVATDETPYALALDAATRLLAERAIDPASIGLLIYGGSPSAMAFASHDDAVAGAAQLCTTNRFQFPGTRLQFELGLEHAAVLAVDQLACATLFGAIRIARAMMEAEGIERALCVSCEFYPRLAGREAIYNCTSDAACAVLLERGGRTNIIVGASTITKGYYWDAAGMREEVVASYFPTAVQVIARTIADAGWTPDELDWVIPHNVSMRSWEILLRLAGLPKARLWSRNIAAHGHTLAGDNFINLRDAICAGAVVPGDRALLFSFGYGAHWCGLAVEV